MILTLQLGKLVLNEIGSLPENEKDKIYEETMSRVKSEVELKVEEMKLQIKADLDTYIKGCVSLQKNAVNYDNMILENAIQQIEYLKREVDRLI